MKNKILQYLCRNFKVCKYFIIQIILLLLFVIINSFNINFEYKLLINIFIVFTIIFCTYKIYAKSIFIGVNNLDSKDKLKELEKRIKSDEVLSNAPKVVIIGGGTGLGNILKGLKEYTSNITAVVTTFDNGRSTRKIKKRI